MSNSNKYKLFILMLGILFSNYAQSGEHTVDQVNKEFSTSELTIKVGDKVNFKNEDPFFHNVFSLSDDKTFDLGSYPQGEQKSVTFENPGEIEVECAIHPDMKMVIKVEE